MSEFDGQQFMLVSWVSVVEPGDDDGEAWEAIDRFVFSFVWNVPDIDECMEEEADSRLLEYDGDIKQFAESILESPFPFKVTSSKLEDVELSSPE